MNAAGAREFVPGFRTAQAVVCVVLFAGVCACDSAEAPTEGGSTADPDVAKRERIGEMYAGHRESFPGISEIGAEGLVELRSAGEVVVVDVREPEERAVSMIPGSISGAVFEEHIETYREKPIVVYCTIGYRSGKYVEKLRARGVEAHNLEGSILSWVHAGQPVVTPGGEETKRVHVYGPQWDLLPEGFESVW